MKRLASRPLQQAPRCCRANAAFSHLWRADAAQTGPRGLSTAANQCGNAARKDDELGVIRYGVTVRDVCRDRRIDRKLSRRWAA